MKKIAVTGAHGNVGKELVKRGCIPLDCDVTNRDEVQEAIERTHPDVIIHCAAITNVGECEKHSAKAIKVNMGGANNVLRYFTKGTFIYISTDHVFEGKRRGLFGHSGYKETDEPNPVNQYGWSKCGGEAVTLVARRVIQTNASIVRTSRLFTHLDLKGGLNDIRTGKEHVYTDLIYRSFLYTPHFVDGLLKLIYLDEIPEIVHIAGADILSYYRFWLLVNTVLGAPETKDKVLARRHEIDDYPRPFRGGLSVRLAKRLGIPIYTAFDGLMAIKEEGILI